MASVHRRVRKRRDGTQTTTYRVRYRDPSGRQRSREYQRKIDAKQAAAEIKTDLKRGDWTDPELGRTPFDVYAEKWIAMKRPLLKEKTLDGYESILRTHLVPAFGASPLNRVLTLDVQHLINDRASIGISARRVGHIYAVLRNLLNDAELGGYVLRSPCRGIDLPKIVEEEMRFWTREEVARIAAAMPEQYRALPLVGAYLGPRWGELCALRRKSLDFLRNRVRISESLSEVGGRLSFGPTKTHESRTLPLPSFLSKTLNDHLDLFVRASADALLFTSPQGQPLRYSNFIRRVWQPALADAGLEAAGTHSLRHTCAALLIADGLQAADIQRHLGHSSYEITMNRYGHLFPDHYDRVADALERTFQGVNVPPVFPSEPVAGNDTRQDLS